MRRDDSSRSIERPFRFYLLTSHGSNKPIGRRDHDAKYEDEDENGIVHRNRRASDGPAPRHRRRARHLGAGAGNLIEGRSGHTATLLDNGKVLVTGGTAQRDPFFPQDEVQLASAELYDPARDRWTSAPNIAIPRAGHTATLLAHRQGAGGGRSPGDANAVLASAQLYDPKTNKWSSVASLNKARAFHTESLLADGRVLIAGGMDSTGASLSSAEIFNPTTGTWSAAGNLIAARFEHRASRLANGKVLVTGGRGPERIIFDQRFFVPIASVEIYNPATNSWTSGAAMSVPRTEHTATVLSSGKVLVAGGVCTFAPECTFTSVHNTAEVFDPAANTWSPTGLMVDFIWNHEATLLNSGIVVVTGAGAPRVADSIYNPATNEWTRLGRVHSDGRNPARTDHSSTLLHNGKLLIAAGRPDFRLAGTQSSILLSLPTTNLPPAQVSNSHEERAQAVFLSTEGCFTTLVSLSGGSIRDVGSPPADPPQGAEPFLHVSIDRIDECLEIPIISAVSEAATDVRFETDPQLQTATLTGVVTMGDSGTGEFFTVSVDMVWTGSGELMHDAGGSGGGGSSHFQLDERLADASGTIASDTTNFTPLPSSSFCSDCSSIVRLDTGGTFLEFRGRPYAIVTMARPTISPTVEACVLWRGHS